VQLPNLSKSLHPTILAFLREYLPIWDGQQDLATISELVSYIPVEVFDDAYKTYLSPIERALATQGITAYTTLVDFYTTFLQQQIASTSSAPADQQTTRQYVLEDMMEHVSTLFTSALVSIPPDSSTTNLTSSILSFYELLSTSSKPHVIPIHLPPMHLIYLLAQDASPTTLSRICGIIGSYKSAFDTHPKPVKTYYPAEVTDAFNYCLRDMYNLVWASRGLLAVKDKSKGLYCDPLLRSTLDAYLRTVNRGYNIATAFTLSYNSCLVSLSAATWRAVEKQEVEKAGAGNVTRYHAGPVSEKSLEVLGSRGGVSVDWEGAGGYKVMVLQWLTERGLGGIRDLMFATVIHLKGMA
jgi:centromere protein I